MSTKSTKKNGNEDILNEQQQAMRARVVELEFKSRYWKAQVEVMENTIRTNDLDEAYNKANDEITARDNEKQAKFMEQLSQLQAKINEENKTSGEHPDLKHTVTEEDLAANPDLVEQGIKVGDEIGIPMDPESIAEDANLQEEYEASETK